MALTPILADILKAGILAPSADNHHHLRFEPTADGVRLCSEPGRLSQLVGYKRTLDLVSLGAVIENIVLQASAHQHHADIELFPEASADLVANIVFSPTETGPDPLYKTIPQRHTNRRFFSGPPADSATLQRIADAAGTVPHCSLTWLDTPVLRRKILPLIRLAEGERFHQKALHTEMFENIRFDVGWDQTCVEALPPGALEVEKPLRPFFYLIRHWSFMRILNLFGAHKQLGWRAGDLPCRLSPHLAVISVTSLADLNQINAGRVFERLWLTLSQIGLAVQPLPASALYAQTATIDHHFPEEIKKQLHAGWKELLPGKTPLVLFRAGHANAPSLVTGRHPIEYYLK